MAKPKKTAYGYFIQICVKGHRENKTFRTIREATAWAESRKSELREESNKLPIDKYTLRYVLERYRDEVSPTKRGARWEEVRINAMLKHDSLPINKPMSECTPDAIGKWRDARLKVVSAGSVLRDIGLLSSVLETARREWRIIESNPVKDVRKPKSPDHRDTIITSKQIKLMLKQLDYSYKDPVRSVTQAVAMCFLLAMRTGMRAGELCALTWDNVKDGYCILPVTKTVPREVPLSRKAEYIINRMKGWDKERVFGLQSNTLDALFRRTRIRAGLDGFVFHDTRHTAATMLAKKVDVLTLCKIFGWKQTSQALTYFNPKASDISKRL